MLGFIYTFHVTA